MWRPSRSTKSGAAAIPSYIAFNGDLALRACGLGILGGVAAGAIVGSAIANSPPPPPPGYYPPPPAGYPRERDDRDDEIARLKSKVGEITMDNELLQTRLETL
jgi:hypothetical protein